MMFEVGDKVRYIKFVDWCAGIYPTVGEIYTVTEIYQGKGTIIRLETPYDWWYSSNSFELPKEIDWFSLNRSVI